MFHIIVERTILRSYKIIIVHRFNPTEFYRDPARTYKTNVLKMLAYKCVVKLYVTPSLDYQERIGFVLYHLRQFKVLRRWNKIVLLNSIFPQLKQAEEPLDYVNMMNVLHLLVGSKVDNDHTRNSTEIALKHLLYHLQWTLKLINSNKGRDYWTLEMANEMKEVVTRIRRTRPNVAIEGVNAVVGLLHVPADVASDKHESSKPTFFFHKYQLGL